MSQIKPDTESHSVLLATIAQNFLFAHQGHSALWKNAGAGEYKISPQRKNSFNEQEIHKEKMNQISKTGEYPTVQIRDNQTLENACFYLFFMPGIDGTHGNHLPLS